MLKQEESELLSAYLDEELTSDERTRVNRLLSESIEWREELHKLKQSKSIMKEMPQLTIPADLLMSLDKQVAEALANIPEEPKASWFARLFPSMAPRQAWSWGGGLAFAAGLVIMLLTGVFSPKQEPIPLNILIAAHTRSSGNPALAERVQSASVYSSQLKTLNKPNA